MIPIFGILEIETFSYCNRRCPGCMRNSSAFDEIHSWYEKHELPTNTILSIFDQSVQLGFGGSVCLSHYNEPFLDKRLALLAAEAKSRQFSVYACSNGDAITEESAAATDGVIDTLYISLYDQPGREQRRDRFVNLFKKTSVHFTWAFAPTHYSPLFDVTTLAEQCCGLPCGRPQERLIVAHTGDMMLCCDDIPGHFELGNVHDHTVQELWWSEKHQQIVIDLASNGGRQKYPHCRICPRN